VRPTLGKEPELELQPRAYEGTHDLEKIKDLLMQARTISPRSGYLHVGDLVWRVFYLLRSFAPREIITLWEDAPGNLWGFTLCYKNAFDLQLVPTLRGSSAERQAFAWSEQRAGEIARGHMDTGDDASVTLYTDIYADDAILCKLAEEAGYEPVSAWLYMTRSLNEPLPEPALPEGFMVRHVAGAHEAKKRADVHFAAFSPHSSMTAEAYRDFMQAPGYTAELDLVTVAPDSQFASFAMCWYDPVNRIGAFEPVGVRPDSQRMGLGKVVMSEGLRRLKTLGAETAMVLSEKDNLAAQSLYGSVGFTEINRAISYSKSL
jgi:ribosomal protein S18 acetylase RimI-like enzyme